MRKIFILHTLIERLVKEAKSTNRLSNLIRDANKKAGEKGTVERRTLLKLLAKKEDVSLSCRQLRALDNYLATMGLGLDRLPLFRVKGILDCLIEKSRLAFLLGSSPRESEHRNDLSRWDTRSLALLQRQIFERAALVESDRVRVEFQIEDVLLNFKKIEKQLTSEPWYPLLEDKSCSVVTIGSPRACHGSELVLSRMFGVPPFRPRQRDDPKLPFAFVWDAATKKKTKKGVKRTPTGFKSAFALDLSELSDIDPKLAAKVEAGKASVLHFQGKNYPVIPSPSQQFKMYAVIAGQRRRDSQVHVVIAGISGPATYAAASLLPKFEGALPHVLGEDSRVMYRLVEVTIHTKASTGTSGDLRRVERAEFVPGIWMWPEQPAYKLVEEVEN